MKKEPNSIVSLTLGIIKVFSDNFSRLLRLLTVLADFPRLKGLHEVVG